MYPRPGALILAALTLAVTPASAQWERIDANITSGGTASLLTSDGTYLYATMLLTGQASALVRSADEGDTWEALTGFPGNYPAPSAFRAVGGVLLAGGEKPPGEVRLLVSLDEGLSWTQTVFPSGVGIPNAFFAADGIFYAGTANKIAVSSDQGASWSNLEAGPTGAAAIAAKGSTLVVVAAHGFLHRSTDAGATWERVNQPIPGQSTLVSGLWMAGGRFHIKPTTGGTLVSDDGITWNSLPTFNAFGFQSVQVAPGEGAWLMTSGIAAPALSFDAGATAQVLSAGFPTNILGQPCVSTSWLTDRYVILNAWGCFNENSGLYRMAHRDPSTHSEAHAELPKNALLLGLWPNPAASRVQSAFRIERPGAVRLSLYDPTGREVDILLDTTLPAGEHEIEVSLPALPSGAYLLRLENGSAVSTRVLVLMR